MKKTPKAWALFVRLPEDERDFWQRYALDRREKVAVVVRRILREYQARVERGRTRARGKEGG